ncbi:MAG: triose-phosphate isomerase [Flavobacteriales bacterium]|nr:triose-phosphate isomerase [Flavobacteriales bacterium]MCW8912685.1 triose-phosphate isomerase [Flavobacteriales bacterium]MCW8938828.1 triose-phosphate isomerase [Flavobacteriales bacterium]MCW8940206.1 triose-phosphate isomerase [Flavobacteriales bacterium]MCW8968148.1 triose-phosphate isomerase [Flavobacteriales bacterium]
MRKKIVAGNWKMNLQLNEAKQLLQDIKALENNVSDVSLIINPPALYISLFKELVENSAIALGAQNCSEHEAGAYTGEIAAQMIKSCGANYVIVGHSERRGYYHETNTIIAEKINRALAADLTPIFCCGELLSEREENNHFKVVEQQLKEGLFHLNENEFKKLVIAYEPVWAIGTGVTATAEQAQEMHAFIRKVLKDSYSEETSQNCPILYGGSCNASNAKELFANPDIDGGLIGGASLKAADFLAIAQSF